MGTQHTMSTITRAVPLSGRLGSGLAL
ncbi:hypothetical protein A2U01_0065288, partial [Trifolium medium]|nr:hypothetical protein [Trifolium medium]